MSDAAKQARERRRLIALYDETQNENFLQAAKSLNRGSDEPDKADTFAESDQKSRGQPEINDRDALLDMAILMERDDLSQWASACQAAEGNPGHSETSTAKRLDKKFRISKKDPDSYVGSRLSRGSRLVVPDWAPDWD